MSYAKFTPQNPIILYMDGSEFEVLRTTNTIKDGKPVVEFILSPFDWTMNMLDIKDNELDYQEFVHGTLKRIYPKSRIIKLSDNPEKPIWLGLCTFHGTSPERKSEELAQVLMTVEENENLQDRIKVLEAENMQLRRENFNYATRAKEFFETQQSFTQPQHMMLPMEQGGDTSTEIKQKMQQK